MKLAGVYLGALLVFFLISSAYGYAEEQVVNFSKVPVFNVKISCQSSLGHFVKHFAVVSTHSLVIPNCGKLVSVSYDNFTWLKLLGKKLDQTYGKLKLFGKTENASTCMAGRATGRDTAFWANPNHCFTKIQVIDNGKNETYTFADKFGNWNITIPLNIGENNIIVRAIDPSGNVANKTLVVNWNPSTTGMVTYYLSKPEYFTLIAAISGFLILILLIFWRTEKKKHVRAEQIKTKLSVLFDKESVMVRKYGYQLFENDDYHSLVRQILSEEPFINIINRAKKKIPDDNQEEWIKSEVYAPIKRLLINLDPNFKSLGNDAQVGLLPVYFSVAKKMIRGE